MPARMNAETGGYSRAMSGEELELIETAKHAAVVLKQIGIPFALGGGCAVYARGGPGSAHDVDILLREQDVDAAVAALTAAGMRREHCPEDWLAKVYQEDRLVDLIFRMAGRPVDDELLSRAEILEVRSVSMPVLSATDIVVGKMLALSAHWCDMSPVLAAVRALREQIDWTVVREQAQRSPYARAFLVLADELRITGDGAPPASTPGAGIRTETEGVRGVRVAS